VTGVDLWWADVRRERPGPGDRAALSAGERTKAAAFRFGADRHRYEVAHVLLRRVLAERVGAAPAELSFGRDPCPTCGRSGGRPTLPGSGLHFSLTHAGDLVGVAVAAVPVGVDVEGPLRNCPCPLAANMHPADRDRVTPLPEPERHAETLRWWARVESLLKCRGEGIGHGLDAYAVLGPGPDRTGLAGGCGIVSLPALPGYEAAVATRDAVPAVTVRRPW